MKYKFIYGAIFILLTGVGYFCHQLYRAQLIEEIQGLCKEQGGFSFNNKISLDGLFISQTTGYRLGSALGITKLLKLLVDYKYSFIETDLYYPKLDGSRGKVYSLFNNKQQKNESGQFLRFYITEQKDYICPEKFDLKLDLLIGGIPPNYCVVSDVVNERKSKYEIVRTDKTKKILLNTLEWEETNLVDINNGEVQASWNGFIYCFNGLKNGKNILNSTLDCKGGVKESFQCPDKFQYGRLQADDLSKFISTSGTSILNNIKVIIEDSYQKVVIKYVEPLLIASNEEAINQNDYRDFRPFSDDGKLFEYGNFLIIYNIDSVKKIRRDINGLRLIEYRSFYNTESGFLVAARNMTKNADFHWSIMRFSSDGNIENFYALKFDNKHNEDELRTRLIRLRSSGDSIFFSLVTSSGLLGINPRQYKINL